MSYGLKKCKKCGKERLIEEFHKDRSRLDGHRNECKTCKSNRDSEYYVKNKKKHNKLVKKYRRKNSEAILRQMRRYKKNNPRKIIYSSLISKCRKNGIEFNLDLEDIRIPDRCPLLDIPLIPYGLKDNRDSSPSVDRKDPTLGYIKGNVAIISYRANRIKNNAKPFELKKIGKRIDDYIKS